MPDYKVKLKANVSDGFFGLFDSQLDGVEIVTADTAKEAIEKIQRKIRIKFDSDEVQVRIADIEEVK